jgi:protein tyrosine/serine phosphatase
MTVIQRLGRNGSLGRSVAPALLVLILLIGARAGALAAPSPTAPQKPATPGLANFHQVAPNIYRGAAPTAEGLKTLRSLKVRTIIDLRIERAAQAEIPAAEALGFTWLHLPMGKAAPTQKQVDTFLAALAKASQEPVYLHCQYGADRTGCMIGIYRVQVQNWSFSRAWEEMRQYGFKPWLSELKAAVRSRAKIE